MPIIYTHTDEAPMLATASFLPIFKGFTSRAGVAVETRDVSLAGRIVAAFSDQLPEELREPDALAELGELAKTAQANIIKLPNISASVPQLKAAIAELQAAGYPLPNYPEDPETDAERDARARYDAVKGSAVNPVLREGNSDRRAAAAVKNYARKHPHAMGEWAADSKTRVATMSDGDFRANEWSVTIQEDGVAEIVHVGIDGEEEVLRGGIPVKAGEVFDATKMDCAALDAFLAQQVRAARDEGLLFSLHLKATMMKVSDPILFGHAVRAFFPQTFKRYGAKIAELGLNPNDGLGAIVAGLEKAEDDAAGIGAGAAAGAAGASNAAAGGVSASGDPKVSAEEVLESLRAELATGPRLSMVDSARGITNLHVPSDVIVDASMPAMIRAGGKVWGPDGKQGDTLAVIPDSSYAGVYQAAIEDCQQNGALDPATAGTVPNVGLMAQKAEEYGSHDKTFEIREPGTVEVRVNGTEVLAVEVQTGDIYRSCQAKDAAIRDWVSLAVRRARLSGMPAIFWLDPDRAHDQQIREKVDAYLALEDTDGLDISIMSPVEATRATLARMRRGEDTISVTGNVLRDYLTDLFPILELGTSAKMLSIVPLMAGGGLFETGAGGSAPRHVGQLVNENHLRWDSLGEFLAISESLRHLARVEGNKRADVLASALDRATETLLNEGRSPKRRTGEPDNRSSHAWLAHFWASELSKQNDDEELAAAFAPIAKQFEESIDQIEAELLAVQGKGVDLGGYYRPDPKKLDAAMRPSATLNQIVASMQA